MRKNEEITGKVVKLVTPDGLVSMSKNDALQKALDEGLDLVEVSQQEDASVCKLMDYSKHLYNLKKKDKMQVKKESVKEIKMGSQIAEHDLKIRANKISDLLKKGSKVKVVVIYKGREKQNIAQGKGKLEQLLGYIDLEVQLLKKPKQEGNTYTMELKVL